MTPEYKSFLERLAGAIDYKAEYAALGLVSTRHSGDSHQALCPWHQDNTESFSYYGTTGKWKCFSGCGQGSFSDFVMKKTGKTFSEVVSEYSEKYHVAPPKPPKPERPPISEDIPAKHHAALLNNPDRLNFIITKRGITQATIEKYQIGYSNHRRRYTLPVRDERGTLINIRLYDPNAKGDGAKMISYTVKEGKVTHKYGEARLYGLDQLTKSPPDVPVIVCEGEFDSLIAAQYGEFHTLTGTAGAATFPQEWKQHFRGRHVYFCYDNDEPGKQGAHNAALILHGTAASIHIITLPEEVGDHGDISDYFVRLGHTAEDFQQLMTDAQEYHPPTTTAAIQNTISPYHVDDAGRLFRWKKTPDGKVSIPLANFSATITKEITEDNGLEISHHFAIIGKSSARSLPEIEVPASQFQQLAWLHKWGNHAICEPGQGTKDYIRHAIQTTSLDITQITSYSHAGWRTIDGNPVYLTSSGGIGGENITVKLAGELQRYCLPLSPTDEKAAIMASLSFLDIAPRSITIPLYALLFLAPLTTVLNPMPNFSGYLYGDTGTRKSTLALALLSHFGDFRSLTKLPNFEDTVNALEKRAFTLKDCLMVLDDYHPSIKKATAEDYEVKAQRMIRAFSNRTGRGRLNSDTSDKGRYEPRGMLLITGEELISLPSSLARVMVLEINKDTVNLDRLTAFQNKIELLPHAMTSFILWVRENVEDITTSFRTAFPDLRAKAFRSNIHSKLPEECAFLQYSMTTVLSWLLDKGIMSAAEAEALNSEAWETFIEVSNVHSRRIEREDPTKKFIEILNALVAQRRVRIEGKDDTVDNPVPPIGERSADLIGWYDEFHFYLLPRALWHSLQVYCQKEGTHFPISERTFKNLLLKRGLITATGREQLAKTVWIQDKARKVLQITKTLLSEVDEEATSEVVK